jgi:LysM repeat protein
VTSPTGSPRGRFTRLLTHLLTTGTSGAVLLLGAPALTGDRPVAAPAMVEAADGTVALASARLAHRWPGHPGRWVMRHRVRPGDTVSELAVRHHAWIHELLAINHLWPSSVLFVGRSLRIPVVLAAAPRWARRHHLLGHAPTHHAPSHHAKRHHAKRHHTKRHHAKRHHHQRHHHQRHHHQRHPWRHAHASRAQVRRVVARTARRHHLSPHVMLAISWQESGWQQYRRSSAGAIGAMQVMPGTGRWLSLYLGRHLNIYGLRDNVLAGVVLFKVLRGMASYRRSIGGYYQGLQSIREHGMYHSTRHYVHNVVAIRRALDRGWRPA